MKFIFILPVLCIYLFLLLFKLTHLRLTSAVWMRKYAFSHTVTFFFHMVITPVSDDFPKQY